MDFCVRILRMSLKYRTFLHDSDVVCRLVGSVFTGAPKNDRVHIHTHRPCTHIHTHWRQRQLVSRLCTLLYNMFLMARTREHTPQCACSTVGAGGDFCLSALQPSHARARAHTRLRRSLSVATAAAAALRILCIDVYVLLLGVRCAVCVHFAPHRARKCDMLLKRP